MMGPPLIYRNGLIFGNNTENQLLTSPRYSSSDVRIALGTL